MALNAKRRSVKLNGYDYSDHYRREETAAVLLEEASLSKDRISAYWKRMRRYYDGVHDINSSTSSFYEENKIPWRAAQSTDGYIHVETQIEPDIPDFEFSPRCSDDGVAGKIKAFGKVVCAAQRAFELLKLIFAELRRLVERDYVVLLSLILRSVAFAVKVSHSEHRTVGKFKALSRIGILRYFLQFSDKHAYVVVTQLRIRSSYEQNRNSRIF